MNINDTIAAISTPHGKGGVAVIRISGTDAIPIAERVFRPKNGKTLSELSPNMTVYGDICMPSTDGTPPQTIDDGMAVCFHAPRSFTGENTVEISCHGGILISAQVLSACLAAGARQAEAGEYTRRAFINGKLTLSEAEALGSLLDAKTEGQLLLSRNGMSGKLSGRLLNIYDRLCEIVTSVYARIDFPDEDLAELTPEEIHERLCAVQNELKQLCATYSFGHAVCEGIRTVICGRTNAGKSSLYNQLVGREAAIVTDIAGTTRDLLEETVTVGHVMLRLCDTAGLRDSDDPVERIGISRAKEQLSQAECILAVFDRSVPLTEEDTSLLARLRAATVPVLLILNKCDLPPAWDEKLLGGFAAERILRVSTLRDEGIDALRERIQRMFWDGTLDLRSDAVVANARQYAALSRALEHVHAALTAAEASFSADISCVDLELAMSALAEVDGRAVTEDIVAQIFSHFCVGK
ncbi:MAG: tRNA uridine-5-carboxymethylaminomethyl(34) synthesis GTPase MnmE [Clostridia bacterium]|nr:tRNA uridine-5-carboxymethylaminomethyl(34) synthesis GTPase MnmE [Clostridia bacterium]